MTSSKVQNAFTVDLEEWYQGLTSTNGRPETWPELESRVVPATEQLLDLLRDYEIRATFFVLGIVAEQHPQLIETIAAEGHEIGVHGYWHRFVSRMTRDEFAAELDLALTAITAVTGSTPLGHRAPYFSINAQTPWAFEVIASRGLHYDSSVFPTRNMLYGYPDAPRFPYPIEGTDLIEFPASTMRVGGRNWPIAGGFYNRVLPIELIRRGLKQVNDAGQPAVLYIHPWEMDTRQVYDQVRPRERLTHYHGRNGLEAKLRRLFDEFCFGPLVELLPAYQTRLQDRSSALATNAGSS